MWSYINIFFDMKTHILSTIKIVASLLVIVGTMFTFLTFSPVFADEAIVYVSPEGDNELADGSEENPYQTISFAVEQANEESTVKVKQGVYIENVVINKPLTLEAVDGVGATEISPETGIAVALSSHGVTVKDFTLKGEVSVLLGSVVETTKSTLQGNSLEGTQFSIATDESTDFYFLEVLQNTIHNTFAIENVSNSIKFTENLFDPSLGLASVNGGVVGTITGDTSARMLAVSFHNNTVNAGFEDGLVVEGTQYFNFFDNVIQGVSRTGLSAEFVTGSIDRNSIESGVQSLELQTPGEDFKRVFILGNTFSGNTVDIDPESGERVASLVFRPNFAGQSRSLFLSNTFRDNRNAIVFSEGFDFSSDIFHEANNSFYSTENISIYNDTDSIISLSQDYWDTEGGVMATNTFGDVRGYFWYLDEEKTIRADKIPVSIPEVENATITITSQRFFDDTDWTDLEKEFLTPPVVTVNGAQTVKLGYKSTVTVTLTPDEGYQSAIIQDNETTIEPVNEYTVDSVIEPHEFVIVSAEDTAPVITLNGLDNLELFVTDIYTEAGATVFDDFDTEARGAELEVVITGEVDTEVPGTYTLAYNATDSAGNVAEEKTRTIVVKEHVVQTGAPSGGGYIPPAPIVTPEPVEPEPIVEPEAPEDPVVEGDPEVDVPEIQTPEGEVLGEKITESTESRIQSTLKREQERFSELDVRLATRVQGRILLQVEENGEAWYVPTGSTEKFYLADGPSAFQALRQFGVGITNEDLAKIPVGVESRFQDIDTDKDGLADKLEEGLQTDPLNADTDEDGVSDGEEVLTYFTNPLGEGILEVDDQLINQSLGTIYLQVESRGEAWYVNPVDGMRYYMKDGNAAFQIMKFLSLGITNTDIARIEVGELE